MVHRIVLRHGSTWMFGRPMHCLTYDAYNYRHTSHINHDRDKARPSPHYHNSRSHLQDLCGEGKDSPRPNARIDLHVYDLAEQRSISRTEAARSQTVLLQQDPVHKAVRLNSQLFSRSGTGGWRIERGARPRNRSSIQKHSRR